MIRVLKRTVSLRRNADAMKVHVILLFYLAWAVFQLDKMKEDVTMKEGEIKLLRENLKSRETDLSKLKQEKINTILEQNKQQTEKEKTLQVQVLNPKIFHLLLVQPVVYQISNRTPSGSKIVAVQFLVQRLS